MASTKKPRRIDPATGHPVPKSRSQIEQEHDRDIMERAGVTTWRIFRTRNDLARTVWMLCHRFQPENPWGAYDTAQHAAKEIIEEGRVTQHTRNQIIQKRKRPDEQIAQ